MTVQKLKLPELLAPAGGTEQLKAAINFGADAVYLAMKDFGMRAKAQNFSFCELCESVKYAHANNVKVYVTVNVMMHEDDISNLPSFYNQIKKANVDAIIVSDLGALSLARKIIPEIDVHISTQAASANSESIHLLSQLGAKRVVLARECTLEQIEHITQKLRNSGSQTEIETFVHGAMCMSVSGRCLISSYLTGRSANKGACTQPCRWGYKLIEEKRPDQNFDIAEDNYGTYLMNSKDLNMSEHLPEIINANISSIKIEGRNKKEMYVASVVNIYRHLLNALEADIKGNTNKKLIPECCKNYSDELKKWKSEFNNLSHRPYSTGFYFNKPEQSVDYDGYEQNRVHCANVTSCQKKCDEYLITVVCKNRFAEAETLEVLIPKKAIIEVSPKNLSLQTGQIVDVANRANEVYTFISDKPIPTNSIIRSKTYLRTSRSSSNKSCNKS